MRFSSLILLFGFVLWGITACSDGNGNSSGGTGGNIQVTPPTQVATLTSIEKTATAIVSVATSQAGIFPTPCNTGIMSEADEAAIGNLQAAMTAEDVAVASINVIVTRDQQDCQRSTVVNTFASVRIETADVTDDATVGDVMAQALRGFVATDLPQPATISLQFEAGTRQRSFNINFDDAQAYIADDLSGETLISAVSGS